MIGFKITNLITDILAFVYSFLFCGLVGGFSFLELFVGSWGKRDDFVTESFVLLLSCGLIIAHGFLLFLFGIISFAAWRKKPKPYLICHLIFSISGIVGTGLLCLLYHINATGSVDVTILSDFLLKGEVLFLIYVAFCALELLLTFLSHITLPRIEIAGK